MLISRSAKVYVFLAEEQFLRIGEQFKIRNLILFYGSMMSASNYDVWSEHEGNIENSSWKIFCTTEPKFMTIQLNE